MFGKEKKETNNEEEEDVTLTYDNLKKYQEKAGLELIKVIETALKANALVGMAITENYNMAQLPNKTIVLTVNTITYDNYIQKQKKENEN